MPEARSRWRSNAADRHDGAPHLRARRLDAQPRAVAVAPGARLAQPQTRQVERAQWVELGLGKARAKILARLAHAHRDRAAALHDDKRVDDAEWARRAPRAVG